MLQINMTVNCWIFSLCYAMLLNMDHLVQSVTSKYTPNFGYYGHAYMMTSLETSRFSSL